MNIAPFFESQPKRCELRTPYAKISGRASGRRHERIRGGDAVLAAAAVLAERVDAEDLAERRAEILRELHRVAAAAAVGDAHVQEPEVGGARTRRRIERDRAAVVIGERLTQPDQLSRRSAVVGRRARRLRRPFEQHGVVRACSALGVVKSGAGVWFERVRVGVELAESRRAGLGELRVEHEALHPALATLRLHGDAPLRIAEVEVRRHRLAIRDSRRTAGRACR